MGGGSDCLQVALTQSCRDVGHAFLVGYAVETENAVNLGERSTVQAGRPLDSPLCAEIDIVQEDFDELDLVGSIFDSHLGGGEGHFTVDRVPNEGGLATVSSSKHE